MLHPILMKLAHTHTLACLTAQWAEHYLGLAARLGDALAILGVVRAHTMHLV